MNLERELIVVDEDIWFNEFMEPALLSEEILQIAFMYSGMEKPKYDISELNTLCVGAYCWHFAYFASAVLQQKYPGEYVNQFLQKPGLKNHACAVMLNDEKIIILDTYQLIEDIKELDMDSPRFLGFNDAIHVIVHNTIDLTYEFIDKGPKTNAELITEANAKGFVLDLIHDREYLYKDGKISRERDQFSRVGKKDFLL